ncbi:Hypothetical protein SMAX5B_010095 [Scophthalmus maximus]|uniref:Uncharacterized protein n=1 Tax=Scophthalmus maximus TaxID=52904 RepID=A0A2U9BZ93_SCOMX|nr:Hypothetical protein SMAX5B_010095 [Scophthalmus maximus]
MFETNDQKVLRRRRRGRHTRQRSEASRTQAREERDDEPRRAPETGPNRPKRDSARGRRRRVDTASSTGLTFSLRELKDLDDSHCNGDFGNMYQCEDFQSLKKKKTAISPCLLRVAVHIAAPGRSERESCYFAYSLPRLLHLDRDVYTV